MGGGFHSSSTETGRHVHVRKKCTTEIAMKITHVNDHLHQLTSPVASSNVKLHYISVSVSCQHIFY